MNSNTYQKLSTPNKQIVDAVQETQKSTKPTLAAIARKYQNITKVTIKKERLLQKLLEIQKTGIIESEIANNNANPIRIWKTKLTQKLFQNKKP